MAEAIRLVSIFWAGLLAGVSFLATPIKFQAESLSLPVALDVGRATFQLMSRVEVGLALVVVVLIGIALSRGAASATTVGVAAVAVVVVGLQALWLLSALDARAVEIVAGEEPGRSALHVVYICSEGAKLVALLGLAVVAGRG